jgi:flagellar motor switch protein FliG
MSASARQLSPPSMRAPQMSRRHKAAIVLAALDVEAAAAVVREISDDHLRAFARALSELRAVPPQVLAAVAAEFVAEVERAAAEMPAGVDEARRLLQSIADKPRSDRLLADLSGAGGVDVWRALGDVADDALSTYVTRQRAPVAAAILANLGDERAAAVLALMPRETAAATLFEIAKGKPAAPAIDAIARAIETELLSRRTAASAAAPSTERIIEVMNCLPAGIRDQLMGELAKADGPVAEAVRRNLLTFENLHLRLTESAATAIMREADKAELLVALKAGKSAAPETVAALLGAISKRMADQYEEEIAALAAPSPEEMELAQRRVLSVVRRLASGGEIALKPPAKE